MGISWSLSAAPSPVEQRTETEQGQCNRGGGNSLCLEGAGAVCSSARVVGNTGWLVLHVSVACLSSGPGWKDGLQEVGHMLQPPFWDQLCR